MNDFQPLRADLNGLENEFDLAYRFEYRESDEYSFNPVSGSKAWGDPFLALYVSFAPKQSQQERKALCYKLTRSEFSGGIVPNSADMQRLLQKALPRIQTDLA